MSPEDRTASHREAISGAYQGRGILAPGAAGRKQTNCWLAGAAIVGIVGLTTAAAAFGPEEWILALGALAGACAGFGLGDWVFRTNFVVDHSLTDFRRDSL